MCNIDKHMLYIAWLMREFDDGVSDFLGEAGSLGECGAACESAHVLFIINQQIGCNTARYFACNMQVTRWAERLQSWSIATASRRLRASDGWK